MKAKLSKIATVVTCILIVYFFIMGIRNNNSNIEIYVNNQRISFMEATPTFEKSDILIPMKDLFTALSIGDWKIYDNDDNRVVVSKGSGTMVFWVNKDFALINGEIFDLEVSPQLIDDVIFVPASILQKCFMGAMDWEIKDNIVNIKVDIGPWSTDYIEATIEDNGVDDNFLFYGLALGDTQEKLINYLGWPNRVDITEYNLDWWIYNYNYSHYIQFGINNGKIIAVKTNSIRWSTKEGISPLSSYQDVIQAYGVSQQQYHHGGATFIDRRILEHELVQYIMDIYTVTFFFDKHNGGTVCGIELYMNNQITSKQLSKTQWAEFVISNEKQLFDLTNAFRAVHGLSPLLWDSRVTIVARNHSKDMLTKGYFSHNNNEGQPPFERLQDYGISFIIAGENIVAGYQDPLNSFHALINSKEHRDNILNSSFRKLGVGFASQELYNTYFTQKFISP